MAKPMWPTPLPQSTLLSHSGLLATMDSDRFVPGSLLLTVGGTPQSHLVVNDPESLQFEYIRRIGNLIDVMAAPNAPLTAVHLGAGALTLPRYLAHTRPHSRQQVIEWEPDLVELVRSVAPWDSSWSIRLRYGDARDVVSTLPEGLTGVVDLVVVDLFAGDHTPAHLTTVEFYSLLTRLLAPRGVVAVNIVDGPGHRFARSQWATLGSLFGFVGVVGEAAVVKGRRFGNLVCVATRAAEEPSWWPELARRGPFPQASLSGSKLADLVSGFRPTTDESATPSPSLGRGFLSG